MPIKITRTVLCVTTESNAKTLDAKERKTHPRVELYQELWLLIIFISFAAGLFVVKINQYHFSRNEMDSKKSGKGSFAFAWVLDETEEERTR